MIYGVHMYGKLAMYARAKHSPKIQWQLVDVACAHSHPTIPFSHFLVGHCAHLRRCYASESANPFCVPTTAETSGQSAIDFYHDDNLKNQY
jgi:hypothetical protein